MSVKIMSMAWEIEGLTSTQKLILLKLADNASDEGYCYPGIKIIEKHTGLSRRAIQCGISELEKIGYLQKSSRFNDQGRQTSNGYTVLIHRGEGAGDARGGCRRCTPEGAGDAPLLTISKEPSIEPGASPSVSQVEIFPQMDQKPAIVPEPTGRLRKVSGFAEEWQRWCEYRLNRKGSRTKASTSLFRRHLTVCERILKDDGPEDLIAKIVQAREKNWEGFDYPLKNNVVSVGAIKPATPGAYSTKQKLI